MNSFIHITSFSVRRLGAFTILMALLGWSCQSDQREPVNTEGGEQRPDVEVPDFSPDSAYAFIQTQVNFGPRVPGTPEHRATGDYLANKLREYGAEVYEQEFEATTWDEKTIPLRNIIGSFYPERKKRLLLAAHWDTRPYSDKDKENPEQPMIGANDGASGVGVLLEIARNISIQAPPQVGVDIIFFDGEDWGEKVGLSSYVPPAQGFDSWWCLGSQYWSRNKHKPGYSAYYGILLDMVGGRGAEFHVEGVSSKFAPRIVDKVWDTAEELGYASVFVRDRRPEITDDHVFVNQVAKIPMINIVPYDVDTGYFGRFHHTQDDNMALIDTNTLEKVGETVQHVVYYE